MRPSVLVAVLSLSAACQGDRLGDGAMRAVWSGADTTEMLGTATALWCGGPRWLEVVGQRGDTGIGLVVYPVDTAHLAGSYPVTPPPQDSAADSTVAPRPGGALALRWFTKETVEGYDADSGTITIEEGAGQVWGTFRGRLRSVYGQDSVLLEGKFGAVAPARDGIECQPTDTTTEAPADPPDSTRG